MKSEQLIENRKRDWERLEGLLKRVEHGPLSALSEAELVEFGRLYRAATSDLAIAQRDFPERDVTLFLNQLVGRAHPMVYRGEPLAWRRLKNFYRARLPQLYRELLPFIGIASLLFFGAGAVVYVIMLVNPDAASYILTPAQIGLIKEGIRWWKDLNEFNEIGSGFVMTNNLRVAFSAYAGGMLLGLLTVYVLVFNGVHLGAVLGLLHYYGNAAPLWEFISGHGVLELSEITMAGGAGLMLGYSVLRPGLLSRKDSLVIAAQKSIRLLLGTAPLLVLAGVIEGMISPSDIIPAWIKYGIGITSGLLLYGYLLFVGRKNSLF